MSEPRRRTGLYSTGLSDLDYGVTCGKGRERVLGGRKKKKKKLISGRYFRLSALLKFIRL